MRRLGSRITSAAVLAVLAFPAAAAAQGPIPPQFSTTVDRDPVVQGEPFEFVISIATESAEDPEVRLPQFRGLRVLRQSESHPMSFSFSFGFGGKTQRQTKRTSNYSFVLVADRVGTIVVDPVLVTVDGKQFQSDPYPVRVVETGAPGSAQAPGLAVPPSGGPLAPDPGTGQGEPRFSQDPKSLDGEALAGAVVDPSCFVQLDVARSEAHVGQMVVLTVWLYTAARVSNVDVIREPGTEGFWVETLLAGQRRLEFEPVVVGGRSYERAVLRKLALFPIEEGTLTIAPVMVEVESRRGGFFSRPSVVKRASPAVQVAVTALPADGQPPGFDPANVGRFAYRVEADRTEIAQGEPVTLTVTVSGEGNLRNINLPLVTEVDGFKVYPAENEVSLRPSEQTVAGTRVSRVLMIPKRHGTLAVPGIPWSFFDPVAGEYRTVHNQPLSITVRPGVGAAVAGAPGGAAGAQPVTDGSSERLGRLLRSIESRATLDPESDELTMVRPWFLVAALAAPFLYIAVLFGSRARQRAAEARIRGRSRRADTVARRELAGLRRQLEQVPAGDFFGGLQRVLTRFLESRLEVAVVGDTMEELRRRLSDRGFPADLAERVTAELECCDFARFARSAGVAEERRQGLERMQALIDRLAGVVVKRPEEERQ